MTEFVFDQIIPTQVSIIEYFLREFTSHHGMTFIKVRFRDVEFLLPEGKLQGTFWSVGESQLDDGETKAILAKGFVIAVPLSVSETRVQVFLKEGDNDTLNQLGDFLLQRIATQPSAVEGKQQDAKILPPVTDPLDKRILEEITKNPDLSDSEIGDLIGLSRGPVNTRRNKLKAMGYTVR